jgi:hypothetical protein
MIERACQNIQKSHREDRCTQQLHYWRPRRSAAPLWNEIRFCERATGTSRAFKSVIIKADHSDRYEGVAICYNE